MRSLLKARYTGARGPGRVRGASSACSAFSPGAAPAGASPTTTLPAAHLDRARPTTPIGQPRAPSVSSVLKYAAPSNQTGIFYVDLPKAFIAPGQALFAANCSSCHGPEALGTTRAPNLQGLGAGTVDFWVSTGRMPLANSSVQATRKPPRFNRLQTLEIAAVGAVPHPRRGSPGAGGQHQRADLEAGQYPVHPQLRGLPHHHRRR